MVVKKEHKSKRIPRHIDFHFFSEVDFNKFRELAMQEGLKPNALARKCCYAYLNSQKK